MAHSVSMPARLASGLHPSPSTSCTLHGSGDATSPLRGCTEWLSVAGSALLCHMLALPRSMPSGPSVSEEEPKCEFAPCRSPSGQSERSVDTCASEAAAIGASLASVVSTLAVCMRSSLNAGPDDVSSRRWSATNGSRGSSRVEFVHAHASGTRSAAPRGICRVTAIVCCNLRQTSAGYWPPSIHGEPLARVSPEAIDGRERPLVRTYSSGPTDGARGRSRAVQLWPV